MSDAIGQVAPLRGKLGRIVSISVVLGVLGAACSSQPIRPPSPLPVVTAPVSSVAYQQRIGEKAEAYSGRFDAAEHQDLLYVAHPDGTLSAVERFSGALRWQRLLEPLSAGVAYDADLLWVVSRAGELLALRADDGELAWKQALPSAVNTPPTARFGTVMVYGVDGSVALYEADSGKRRWATQAEQPTLTENATSRPVLVPGGAILGLANGRVAALRSDTGAPLWEAEVDERSDGSLSQSLRDVDGDIALDDDYVYAGSVSGRTISIDPANGQARWRSQLGVRGGMAIFDEALVGVDGDDHVFALRRADGSLLWRQDALRFRKLTKPVILGELLVVGDAEGYVHRLSLTDGRLVGQQRLSKAGFAGAPVVTPDGIYFQSWDGVLTRLEP